MFNFVEELLAAAKDIGSTRSATCTSDRKERTTLRGALSGPSLREHSVLVGLIAMSWLCPAATSAQPVDAAETKAPRVRDLAPVPSTMDRRPKPPCSPQRVADKLAELRAPITDMASSAVRIDCSLTLREGEVIKKRLLFMGNDASGVTVDGKGATIDGSKGTFNYNTSNAALMVEIASEEIQDPATGKRLWHRPVNVTLRNIKIKGSVAISGVTGVSSSDPNYVTIARDNAPSHIVFDHVTITGLGLPCGPDSGNCNLLYVYSGVGYFQMLNSEINGYTSEKAVNIYLDDTSYRNTFRNNTISATTLTREVIAIDGSSENIIVDNRFKVINGGGIFLYRNCGESGSVRRGTPSQNTIVNNIFFYDYLDAGSPAIVVASRNGRGTKTYTCPPNFFDLARFNVVMQNQIMPDRPSISDSSLLGAFIKVDRADVNAPNFIKENAIVDAVANRGAGCYISDGYPDFIRDGQFVNVFHTPTGEPVCRGYRLSCNDGVLIRSSDPTCQVSQVGSVDFECQANGNNNGCQRTVSVPKGKTIIGAKAACNLEFGTVSSTDLNGVPPNAVKVVRVSDNVSQGRCTLGDTRINSNQSAVSFIGLNQALSATGHVSFGCREHDANGGDCHIKGRLHFR